jgi:hypothetical protein
MLKRSAQPLPAHRALEMQELAGAYQLGALVAEYRGGFTRGSIIGIAIGVLLLVSYSPIIVIGLIAGGSISTSSLMFELVAFLLGIVILWISMRSSLQRKRFWRVYVFERGFIFTSGGQPDVFRWQEVRAIWWEELNRTDEFRSTIQRYTVERSDGQRVVFDNKIHKVQELGTILCEQVAQAMWLQTLADYQAGRVILFGPLRVSQQGVSKGRKLLPWADIAEIKLSYGYVDIHQKGKLGKWAEVPVGNIPNLFLFRTLTRSVLGK